MRIDVLTLFPEMFPCVLDASILGRARAAGLMDVRVHDIRAYTDNKHKRADDYPFGGGAGLVMMAQPIYDCVEGVLGGAKARRIYLSPRGRRLTPQIARALSQEERLLLLCGHYEGVDERVMAIMDEELSIGDYVLTGGELPALVLIDCLSRFIPGVLGSDLSAEEESFSASLLEYPQYTRPAEFRGMAVPEVLLSGHHANIQAWRKAQSIIKTKENRPDLLAEPPALTKLEQRMLKELEVGGGVVSKM